MEVKKAIKTRRSVHSYDTEKKITDEQLRELFDLVGYTPSGYNLQPWEFIVVRDPEMKKKLKEACHGQKQVEESSAPIIVLGNKKPAAHAQEVFKDWAEKKYIPKEAADKILGQVTTWDDWPEEERRVWTMRSTVLAAMTLMYAAEDMGLATGPMEGYDRDKVRDVFGISEDYEVVMVIVMGYMKEPQPPRLDRRQYEEIVHFDKFGKRPV